MMFDDFIDSMINNDYLNSVIYPYKVNYADKKSNNNEKIKTKETSSTVTKTVQVSNKIIQAGGTQLIFYTEAAGFKTSDIKISTEDNTLIIKGETTLLRVAPALPTIKMDKHISFSNIELSKLHNLSYFIEEGMLYIYADFPKMSKLKIQAANPKDFAIAH